MKRMIGLALTTAALSAAAVAQEVSPFNTEDCPQRPVERWCASRALKQGWKLEYEYKSPVELMDVSQLSQIWTRDRTAMLCELSARRGAISRNSCYALSEVAQ